MSVPILSASDFELEHKKGCIVVLIFLLHVDVARNCIKYAEMLWFVYFSKNKRKGLTEVDGSVYLILQMFVHKIQLHNKT